MTRFSFSCTSLAMDSKSRLSKRDIATNGSTAATSFYNQFFQCCLHVDLDFVTLKSAKRGGIQEKVWKKRMCVHMIYVINCD